MPYRQTFEFFHDVVDRSQEEVDKIEDEGMNFEVANSHARDDYLEPYVDEPLADEKVFVGQPISMKLATQVGFGEIFQKPKWFCFLPFSSIQFYSHLFN